MTQKNRLRKVARGKMRSIVVVDVDMGMNASDLERYAAAQQRQILEHLYPVWGEDATVRVSTSKDPARDDEWHHELRRVPTDPGALGVHKLTPAGCPILFTFPELDAEDGVDWTTTGSHETTETLINPWLRGCYQADDGSIYAGEVADAVEQDSYEIDGVKLSNFCFPFWFEPPDNRDGLQYDQMGLCKHPWEIRPGGYGQKWLGESWSMVGSMRPGRAKRHALGLSRTTRLKARVRLNP